MAKENYKVINPHDGNLLYERDCIADNQINVELDKIIKGSNYLSALNMDERKTILIHLAKAIDADAENLAKTISREMGKPITQAKGEVKKCADMARYYAANGPEILQTKVIDMPQQRYEIQYKALGPILFIATWNNPLLQAVLAVVPQIISGNAAIVKPAPNAPGCALAIDAILEAMDLPHKIYWVALTTIPQTEALLKNTQIKGVTFIGSTNVGKRVAELVGASFKRAVIDAGGSDPMLVLPDADLDQAVEGAVAGRFSNTGQSCIAAKRIIVHDLVHDEFLKKFIDKTHSLKQGDPLDEATTIGPQATFQALDKLSAQVEKAVQQGAKIWCGGKKVEGAGAYFEPTILSNITCDMLPSKEEVFGPVAAVYKASDVQEMLELANDTPFGLGASVYGKEVAMIVDGLETANVSINTKVATTFEVPFGGIKESGYGVYFGEEGLKTFTNAKVISYLK